MDIAPTSRIGRQGSHCTYIKGGRCHPDDQDDSRQKHRIGRRRRRGRRRRGGSASTPVSRSSQQNAGTRKANACRGLILPFSVQQPHRLNKCPRLGCKAFQAYLVEFYRTSQAGIRVWRGVLRIFFSAGQVPYGRGVKNLFLFVYFQ